MNNDSTTRDPALTALYRQIATEPCPESVDAAVLAAARQPPQSARQWQPALAMAASVLLAFMVGRELDLDPGVTPASNAEAPATKFDISEPVAAPSELAIQSEEAARDDGAPISLDSVAPSPDSIRSDLRRAAERTEQELDAELGEAMSTAAPAEYRQSVAAPELAAPPAGALASRLREAAAAGLDADTCDPETSPANALRRCWRARLEAGRAEEAAVLRAAFERRFPTLELGIDPD